jgi:hypothetical protein
LCRDVGPVFIMPLPILPPEILDIIIDLVSHGWERTLALACALVSRHWLDRSRSRFTRIALDKGRRGLPLSFPLFAAFLYEAFPYYRLSKSYNRFFLLDRRRLKN